MTCTSRKLKIAGHIFPYLQSNIISEFISAPGKFFLGLMFNFHMLKKGESCSVPRVSFRFASRQPFSRGKVPKCCGSPVFLCFASCPTRCGIKAGDKRLCGGARGAEVVEACGDAAAQTAPAPLPGPCWAPSPALALHRGQGMANLSRATS